MLFNSSEFVIFFATLFALYYFIFKEKTKSQNILLLVASYFFYACADWKLLPLLIAATLVYYGLGLAIFKTVGSRRATTLSTLGVVFGIAVLGYFKYTNFFISSFQTLFESLGLHTNWHTFKIIVPIGISFYTFRLLSYVIDISRGKYEPARDLVAFATYVAFFPCILSGPIDRPNTLIPQLQKKRIFDYALATDGLRQILWGMFKKMVIADNCAAMTGIGADYMNCSGSTLLLGTLLYTLQMYADFSGYTDMVIGVGKLLGFQLTKNFACPLFAQNIADYWRKWHISLTSWLTDYVFMPLNIKWRDWGNWGMALSIIITFVLIGSWHGASWTFVIFGLYHGLLYVPLILSGGMFKKTKIETGKWGFPKLKTLAKMLLTFFLVSFGLILFRADSLTQAWNYLGRIFSASLFAIPAISEMQDKLIMSFFIAILLLVDWVNRDKQHGLQMDNIKSSVVKWLIYFSLIVIIWAFGGSQERFIYFQF
ncbi:O-acyltransferase [Bacteroidia bacterium]|nr:O-acyltransferase [Bacteroidia bacterium]